MEQKILTARQYKALCFFGKFQLAKNFYFSGGTALAAEIGAKKIEYTKTHDRNLFFLTFGKEILKLEFTKYNFPKLGRRVIHDRVLVDSLRDLSANKLMALLDRFDPKDFVDLYFILKKRSLTAVKIDAQKKFNIKLDPLFIAAEFAKVRRIVALPQMLRPLTIEQLKTFFEKQIKDTSTFINL